MIRKNNLILYLASILVNTELEEVDGRWEKSENIRQRRIKLSTQIQTKRRECFLPDTRNEFTNNTVLVGRKSCAVCRCPVAFAAEDFGRPGGGRETTPVSRRPNPERRWNKVVKAPVSATSKKLTTDAMLVHANEINISAEYICWCWTPSPSFPKHNTIGNYKFLFIPKNCGYLYF